MHHSLKVYTRFQQSFLKMYIFLGSWTRIPLIGRLVRLVANSYGSKVSGGFLLTAEEAEQMTFLDIVHPDSREHCQRVFSQLLKGEDVGRVDVLFSSKDGRIVDSGGTTWDRSGFATDGPLSGTQLQHVTSFVSEWYGWVAFYPDTTIYQA